MKEIYWFTLDMYCSVMDQIFPGMEVLVQAIFFALLQPRWPGIYGAT